MVFQMNCRKMLRKKVISILNKQFQIRYRKGKKFSHFILQIKYNYVTKGASLVAQTVKNLPAMQKTREKEMATHSSILAYTIPWTEDPGGLQSMGS